MEQQIPVLISTGGFVIPSSFSSRKGCQVKQLLERRRETWRLKEQDRFRKHLWEMEWALYRADMQKAGQG